MQKTSQRLRYFDRAQSHARFIQYIFFLSGLTINIHEHFSQLNDITINNMLSLQKHALRFTEKKFIFLTNCILTWLCE